MANILTYTLTFDLNQHLTYFLTVYLTFYLTYILTFCPTFCLIFYLALHLTYILTYQICGIFRHLMWLSAAGEKCSSPFSFSFLRFRQVRPDQPPEKKSMQLKEPMRAYLAQKLKMVDWSTILSPQGHKGSANPFLTQKNLGNDHLTNQPPPGHPESIV